MDKWAMLLSQGWMPCGCHHGIWQRRKVTAPCKVRQTVCTWHFCCHVVIRFTQTWQTRRQYLYLWWIESGTHVDWLASRSRHFDRLDCQQSLTSKTDWQRLFADDDGHDPVTYPIVGLRWSSHSGRVRPMWRWVRRSGRNPRNQLFAVTNYITADWSESKWLIYSFAVNSTTVMYMCSVRIIDHCLYIIQCVVQCLLSDDYNM